MNEDELSPKEKEVYEALKQVIDPELGVSIVDLGLIYSIKVDDENVCHIHWTLTTMGCPIIEILQGSIYEAAMHVKGIAEASVKLVYYPQWTPEKMSQSARIALGVHL